MLDDRTQDATLGKMPTANLGIAETDDSATSGTHTDATREILFPVPEDIREFEPLIDVTNHLDLTFAYNGPVELRLHNRVAMLPCEIAWNGTEGTLSCDDPSLQVQSFVSNGRYGVALRPDDLITGSFDECTLSNVRLTSLNYGEHGAHVIAAFDGLKRGEPDPAAAFHTYIYHGLTFQAYPRILPTDDARRGFAFNGLATEAFDRVLLIRELTPTTNGEPSTIVGHRGERFTDRQLTAIWLVLSFLCGRKTARIGDLQLDADGHEQFRCTYRTFLGGVAGRTNPPIQLFGNGWGHVLHQLPTMFTACHSLLDENIPIDIALEYLFGSQTWIDDTLRRLNSALDCLIEADAFSPTKSRIVVDETAYARFVNDLMPHVETIVTDRELPTELVGRIKEQLKGANDVRLSERRNKFWKRVGFEPGPNEKKARRTRDKLAHRGYVLRGATDDDFDATLANTHIMRNLVNRTILALLGYRGPLLDYRKGLNVPFDEQVGT